MTVPIDATQRDKRDKQVDVKFSFGRYDEEQVQPLSNGLCCPCTQAKPLLARRNPQRGMMLPCRPSWHLCRACQYCHRCCPCHLLFAGLK